MKSAIMWKCLYIAGKTFSVEPSNLLLGPYYADFISNEPSEICICFDERDIGFEQMKAAEEDILEGLPIREYSEAYLETIALQRKVVEEFFTYDTLLFHGSVVAVDGQAYLFTAKSGTGKSTHTRLWREMLGDRAVMVNNDKLAPLQCMA